MTETADPQETGRRQGKSAAAFRTISEVASDLDIPAHVLRFWESKFAQVKPLKRGGGRRYYRPEDIELLRGIRELLYTDGYTIKGVQKLLREGGVKQILAEQSGKSEQSGQPRTPTSDKAAVQPEAPEPSTQAVSTPEAGAIDRTALQQVLGELEDMRASLKNVGI
ncbi:MAG: DNA-binding transcriptional MerR regulator [Paracoccaceae bacterium]|jgi:DNA-binding transcriptional MerR regulator